MEEFFFKISNKEIKIKEEVLKKSEVISADYNEIKRGNIEDIYKYSFPEENFLDFYVNDTERKLKIIKLHTYRFNPQGSPKAIVIMFHGLNSHINHGSYTAKMLADEGYLVVGYDHRGFGKSEGLSGYIESVDLLYSDAKLFISNMISLFPDLSFFLLGMSLGALICYKLTLEFPKEFKGVIMLSPALRPIQNSFFAGFGVFLGWVLSKPKTVKPRLDFAVKSEYCKEKLLNDPYTYTDGTRLGTIKSVIQGMDNIDKTFSNYTVPFIVFVGGKDTIIDISASFELIEHSKSQDKRLWYYDNMYHDIWNEEEIFDISPKIVKWINERNV
jgi:acylglycerol lipase